MSKKDDGAQRERAACVRCQAREHIPSLKHWKLCCGVRLQGLADYEGPHKLGSNFDFILKVVGSN